MNKEDSIRDWQRMYDALTDPEERAKAKRRFEREQRGEEKISDTGL